MISVPMMVLRRPPLSKTSVSPMPRRGHSLPTLGSVEIRRAEKSDAARMAEIYGHDVAETVITFDLEAPLVSDWERRLRASADAGYPVLVGCVDARVIGFALLMAGGKAEARLSLYS